MKGGFSFCGVDIEDLGFEYAPDQTNTYVFKPSSVKLSEQTFDAHDGGYYFGYTTETKQFSLRCIFHDNKVTDGIVSKIYGIFRTGRTGKLIFKQRPWIYYMATVQNVDFTQFLTTRDGIITINLKSYFPFSRTYNLYNLDDEYFNDREYNSGLLSSSITPSNYIVSGGNITTQTSALLYNGGTEKAKVAIEIAGDVGSGVTIANATTGQSISFVALTSAITTNAGLYYSYDCLSGKGALTNGAGVSTMAFLYHHEGTIDLAPSFPIKRNISVTTNNTSTVSSEHLFDETDVGKYIYLASSWMKIVAFTDDSHVTVSTSVGAGTTTTNIVTMNEITITPSDDRMSLSKLNFIYLPTFA